MKLDVENAAITFLVAFVTVVVGALCTWLIQSNRVARWIAGAITVLACVVALICVGILLAQKSTLPPPPTLVITQVPPTQEIPTPVPATREIPTPVPPTLAPTTVVLPTLAPPTIVLVPTPTNIGPGDLTPDDVLQLLIPDPNERKAVLTPQNLGNHWKVETLKVGRDPNGVPCCGQRITFRYPGYGRFDYNGDEIKRPLCHSSNYTEGTVTNNWHMVCTGDKFDMPPLDGVSWYPDDK
jgi:hypothetical protein